MIIFKRMPPYISILLIQCNIRINYFTIYITNYDYITRLRKISENSKEIEYYASTFLYVKLKSFLGLSFQRFNWYEILKFCLRGQGVWTLVGRYLSGTIAFPSESICLYTMPDTPDKYFPWRNSSGVRNVPKVTIMPVDRDYSSKPRRVSAAQGETTFDQSCDHSFDFPRQSSFPWETFSEYFFAVFGTFRRSLFGCIKLSYCLKYVIIVRSNKFKLFYEFI